MLKLTESQAAEFVAELAQKCDRRWQETVDQTRFMNELRDGKLKQQTIQLFYRNWGSFVPVINSVYTSAFYRHLWFFVKNVDLMEVYTQKLLDEFGHPSPPGHIQILMSTGKALGLSKEEVLLSPMLPACRALPDFHRTLLNDGQIQEYWFSVLWERPFGNSRSQITWRRDADGPDPIVAGRNHRTSGLFGGILRGDPGRFERLVHERLL
jgi:pyrroloquinoline quinone (PQQ) biosynthesis protein C